MGCCSRWGIGSTLLVLYSLDLSLPHTRTQINNTGSASFAASTGLQTHFAVADAASPYVRTLGLGLLQYLDMRNPAQPELQGDVDHTVHFAQEPLDRWYPDTMHPNELYFTSGDRSHVRLVQQRGFNNTHVYHPFEILPYPLWK